jgi:L-arabinose isomerase
VDAEILRDWARIMEIEFAYIGKDTDPVRFEQELALTDLLWRNK